MLEKTFIIGSIVANAINISNTPMQDIIKLKSTVETCTEKELSQDEQNKLFMDRMSIEEFKDYQDVDVELTFYTDLDCENGQGPIDAIGNRLEHGTIAIPRDIPLGVRFDIKNYGTYYGNDRGSTKHIYIDDYGKYHIDMFIPREYGETDDEYWTRVNNMGRVNTTAKMHYGVYFDAYDI